MSRGPAAEGRESMTELVLRVGPRMERFLARRCIPPEEAQDLIQDTFLGLVRQWRTIRCPEAWLMGAIRLRLYRYFKANRQRAGLLCVETGRLEAWAPAVPAPQWRAELLWDLATLGRLLPRAHWLLLYLRFGLGLSTEEIAVRLGYRPDSVRKLSSRALRRLARGVAEEER